MAARLNPVKLFLFLFILVVPSQFCKANINHGYVLYSGQTMYKYDTLKYGNYTLKFQTDCRLVLSDTGKQIWASSNRAFDQRCKCGLEDDGNLSISDMVEWIWSAFPVLDFHPFDHYVLVLQKDRNLVIYGPVLWQTGTDPFGTRIIPASSNERYVLHDGETINPGESLKNGRFSLVMQNDCNLVLYDGETSLWSTKTADENNNCVCKLKSDGNLIVYKTWDVRPYWSAMEGRSWRDDGHYVLVLQSNGNLVIYDKPIWSTGTHIVKTKPAINGYASINGSA